MSRYTFTTGTTLDHANHNWEDWHAYLASSLPHWVTADANGICCHDCEQIVVDLPAPDVAPSVRQDDDGNVYLGYFVAHRQAGFCWTGDLTQPIEVCYGGMGEPVVDRFPARMSVGTLIEFLAAFKLQCDEYLTNNPED